MLWFSRQRTQSAGEFRKCCVEFGTISKFSLGSPFWRTQHPDFFKCMLPNLRTCVRTGNSTVDPHATRGRKNWIGYECRLVMLLPYYQTVLFTRGEWRIVNILNDWSMYSIFPSQIYSYSIIRNSKYTVLYRRYRVCCVCVEISLSVRYYVCST